MISRQAAIELIHSLYPSAPIIRMNREWREKKYKPYIEVEKALKMLPSVQPERKTGRWLIRKGISDAQCSECKMYFSDVYDMENSDAFCRHCGAKMEGLKVVKRG